MNKILWMVGSVWIVLSFLFVFALAAAARKRPVIRQQGIRGEAIPSKPTHGFATATAIRSFGPRRGIRAVLTTCLDTIDQ